MSFQLYNSQSRPTSNNRTLLQTKREISCAYQFSQKIFRVRRPFIDPHWSWSCSGLESPHFWFDKETTMSRQFIYRKNYWTILRSLEAFLFQMNRDNSGNSIDLILVGKCPLSLPDYRKEETIQSMNLINSFGARGYSIHGVSFPIVLLT